MPWRSPSPSPPPPRAMPPGPHLPRWKPHLTHRPHHHLLSLPTSQTPFSPLFSAAPNRSRTSAHASTSPMKNCSPGTTIRKRRPPSTPSTASPVPAPSVANRGPPPPWWSTSSASPRSGTQPKPRPPGRPPPPSSGATAKRRHPQPPRPSHRPILRAPGRRGRNSTSRRKTPINPRNPAAPSPHRRSPPAPISHAHPAMRTPTPSITNPDEPRPPAWRAAIRSRQATPRPSHRVTTLRRRGRPMARNLKPPQLRSQKPGV